MVHDIGHPVLGHFGEGLITETIFKIFAERGINGLGDVGAFMHHIHGVHVVDRIEKRRGHDGYGLCLTDQVRHAILSHNGEDEVSEISPDRNIDPEADIRRYIAEVIRNSGKVEFKGDIANAEDVARYMKEVSKAVKMAAITPATLEACIPRLVDTLQYGPNDLDDFIVAGLVKRDEIPEYVARELGTNAGDMIHTLVVDMIVHSYGKDRIGYSRRIAEVLMRFKREFLYPIYGRMDELLMDGGGGLGIMDVPKIDLKRKMLRLFRRNLRVLENPGAHRDSPLIADFFEGDVDNIARYQDRMWHIEGDAKNIQTVVDYVAGLTDRAFFRGSC
jgi:dGTP triphosphohydrolase